GVERPQRRELASGGRTREPRRGRQQHAQRDHDHRPTCRAALESLGHGRDSTATRKATSLESVTGSASRRRNSYAEYLELDETSNVKLEFFDGEIFATAGGTPEHAALAMNVGIAMAAARERGCNLHSSDLRVRVL